VLEIQLVHVKVTLHSLIRVGFSGKLSVTFTGGSRTVR